MKQNLKITSDLSEIVQNLSDSSNCLSDSSKSFSSKCLKNSNKISWKKRDDQLILIVLMRQIVKCPYLEYGWEIFKGKYYLNKIKKCMEKNSRMVHLKINKIQRIHHQKYYKLDIFSFLIQFYQNNLFSSRLGKKYVSKLHNIINGKSKHMQMLDEAILKMKSQQKNIDDLFQFIMGDKM